VCARTHGQIESERASDRGRKRGSVWRERHGSTGCDVSLRSIWIEEYMERKIYEYSGEKDIGVLDVSLRSIWREEYMERKT
jgi:hypothetical protein